MAAPPRFPPPAGVDELRARDRAARRAAQREFDRPLVIEAGAGTGKTTTLVARLLAWSLGPGWEKGEARRREDLGRLHQLGSTGRSGGRPAPTPEQVAAGVLGGVVAITFTEAAAAEMAGRTARELAALARGGAAPDWLAAAALPPAAELARRARALTATLDHLAVRTIHAFCLGLLATYPLEAGVHPQLTVDADGRLLERIIDETVEAALRRGYGSPGDPHLLALAGWGIGPREVAAALADLAAAGLPASALAADPLAPPRVESFRRRLAESCAGLQALLASRLGADPSGWPAAGGRGPGAGRLPAKTAAVARGLAQLGAYLAAAGARGLPGTGAPAAPSRSPASPAPEPAPDSGFSAFEAVAGELAALAAAAAAALPPVLVKLLEEWSRGSQAGLANAGSREDRSPGESAEGGGGDDELARRAGALCRLLAHLARLDPERLRHARLALAPLLAAVEGETRRRGVATFDSLLRGAETLLASHPEVRRRVHRGIDQLLVDEFQDTDRTQCEILRWIALAAPPEERPGLFLVGDPKQSIYGWRNADLLAYDNFIAGVRAAGGEVMALAENFRSVPPILDEVAATIAPVMRESPGLQPRFEPLLACAPRAADPLFSAGGRAPIEFWVSWLPAEQPEPESSSPPAGSRAPSPAPAVGGAAAELEAAAIAADLRQLHDREGVPWRETAILLRGMGDLDLYLEALRDAGIPFAVGRDRQYYRRREVIDAAALVRAVLDPGDHLALVTALRSPLVGVPDAAWLPLWSHGLPRRMTELLGTAPAPLAALRQAIEEAAAALPAEVPGLERLRGWEASLLAAVEQLAVLRESFESEPADLFVERLRRLFLLDLGAAARYLGAYRLANLDRFFRQLLAELEQGSGDVTALLEELRENVAEGRDAEEGQPAEGTEEAVRVLTIHGAKGLDFGHVYLPQLHKGAGFERGPATAAARAAALDGRFELQLFAAPTLDFDLVEAARSEVEAAERVRTLYVAMTRAKERLVLAGAWPRGGRAPAPERARNHLQLLAHRPGLPDLDALWQQACDQAAVPAAIADERLVMAEAPPTGPPRIQPLWKFPGVGGSPVVPAPAGASAENPNLPAPAAVAAQAAALAAHRAAAAERMRRPYAAAASEEAHARLREHLAESWAAGGGGVAAARAASTAKAEETPEPADGASGATGGSAGATPRSIPGAAAADRWLAMAAGAAIHRALESWDLEADLERERARQQALLPAYLAALSAADLAGDPERALPRAAALLDRFCSSGLALRLHDLRSRLLARELPVLLPPLPEAASGPVGVISGAIDLLYSDPATGALVVADYKTDEVEGPALAQRAALYASQGAAYLRAIREALAPAQPPRFELWFLHAGEIVEPPLPPESRESHISAVV
ncbi:MAG TPA: UvrD-helicase domain-containing protein [Thermoanaerobaculia bacterium]|nr:UvrD-helicase domain-containing protein [Thermoanaerobaculia bacterium]